MALASTGQASAEQNEMAFKAWIETVDDGDQIELKSMALDPTGGEVSYSLTVERISPAGTSRTSQGGSVYADAGKATILSRSRVNGFGAGTLRATLEVTRADGQTQLETLEIKGP